MLFHKVQGAGGLVGAGSGSGAGEDLFNAFYSVAEFQNNDSLNETNTNYSVSEVQQNYSGTGRLYLIHKATGATSYYNDAPIACIQVLNESGTSINQQWWFGSTSSIGQGWKTNTGQYDLGNVGSGVSKTPSQVVSSYVFTTNVAVGRTANRFSIAHSTGSNDTGATGGILQPSSPMTLGEQTMSQGGTYTYYMYRETSGAIVPRCSLCRSPSRTWTGGEIIRIAYIIGNVGTSNYYTPDDTFFLGIQ